MKLKMKPWIIAIAMVLVLSLGVGATWAYFTASKEVVNTFTFGSVDIELTEPAWDADAEHPATPGVEYTKDPIVTNTGENGAWVRMHVTVSDCTALMNNAKTPYSLKSMFDINDTTWKFVSKKEDGNTITFTYNYKTPLGVDDTTIQLFTKVTVPTHITSEDLKMPGMDDGFDVTVKADAIQVETFDTVERAFAAFDAQK